MSRHGRTSLMLAEDQTREVKVPGVDVPVMLNAQGEFHVNYLGENFYATTADTLAVRARRIEVDVQDKRDKAAAAKRRQAAKAFPGMLWNARERSLTPVAVRGVHQTTRKVLITRPDGSKDSASTSEVLRVLTGEERTQLLDQQNELARMNAVISSYDKYDTVLEQYGDVCEGLRATYDESRCVFQVEYEGETLESSDLGNLVYMVQNAAVAKTHPVVIARFDRADDREIGLLRDLAGYSYNPTVFTDEVQAQEYLAKVSAYSALQKRQQALLASFKADTSSFTDGFEAVEEVNN